MAAWTAEQVAQIASAEEVQVLIRLVEAVVQEVTFASIPPHALPRSWWWPLNHGDGPLAG